MQKKDLIRKCVVENIDIPFVACQNRNEEKVGISLLYNGNSSI